MQNNLQNPEWVEDPEPEQSETKQLNVGIRLSDLH